MLFLDGATLLQALGLATLALLAFLACSNALPRWRMRRLPGPRPTWLLGNAGKDRSNANQLGPPGKSHLALDRWARRFGGCFVMFMGRQPQVVLSGGWGQNRGPSLQSFPDLAGPADQWV